MQKGSSIANRLERKGNVTDEQIAAAGGKWNDDYACYDFPDGSCGNFTHLSGNAAVQTLAGEPIFRFRAIESRPRED